MHNVIFTNYDGDVKTLQFNPGEQEYMEYLSFHSEKEDCDIVLIITSFSNPDTADIKLFMVECMHRLGHNKGLQEFCENERELCDFLRSYLYSFKGRLVK